MAVDKSAGAVCDRAMQRAWAKRDKECKTLGVEAAGARYAVAVERIHARWREQFAQETEEINACSYLDNVRC